MTIRIMLACAGGMSTSLLAIKIKEAAVRLGEEITVGAMGIGSVEKVQNDIDILLIGPQVRYQLPKVLKSYEGLPVTIQVIESLDYGRMEGGKILKRAIEEYQINKTVS